MALSLDIVKHQHRSVSCGQRLECLVKPLAQRRIAIWGRVCWLVLRELLALGAALALAYVAEGAVDRQPVNPCGELAIASKFRKPAKNTDKGLLHNLFRIRRPDNPRDKPKNSAFVPVIKQLHRLALAPPTGLNKLRIISLDGGFTPTRFGANNGQGL